MYILQFIKSLLMQTKLDYFYASNIKSQLNYIVFKID